MFDWKLGLFILQLLTMIGTVTIFAIIKTNDLRHLKIDIDNFKKDIKEKHDENNKKFEKITDILTDIGKAIVEQNVKCNERYGK